MHKQLLIVIFFAGFLFWVGIKAVSGIYDPAPVAPGPIEGGGSSSKGLSFFKGVNYFLYQDGQRQLYLNASELIFGPAGGDHPGQKVNFLLPQGTVYGQDGEEILYSGQKGQYQPEHGYLHLQEQVMIKKQQDSLAADQVRYQQKEGMIQAQGQVKTTNFLNSSNGQDVVQISAERLSSSTRENTGTYSGNVRGVIDRHKKYETDVLFAAQQLFLNKATSWAELTGEVEIKQNNFVAQAKRGELFLESYGKKLKYYVLYDDVKVKEKLFLDGHRKVERKAFSEQLEGLVAEDKLVLKGFPRVIQGDDTVKGNLIVLRQNNEIVEVDDAHTNWMVK